MSRPWVVGDFVNLNKKSLQIRGYVDYYGGYANHTRAVIDGLEQTGKYSIRLTPIKALKDIHPDIYAKMNWYTQNPSFRMKGSTFLCIGGPGWMQQEFIPQDGRRKIGWTMVETLGVQKQIVEWCNNMDTILCPTEIDRSRFKRAGVKNLEIVPIGYDPEIFHKEVKPLDISNVRNRYVFGVLGSWNHRKGVESIVNAYCMQYTNEDPVSLLLVCKYGNRPYGELKEEKENWGLRVELQRCLDRLHMEPETMPHICVLDVPVHPPIVPHIYSRIDCLVGFSMGESTWLPGLEMAAIGRPIIQLKNMACGYMDYLGDSRYMCQNVEYVECDERLYEGTSEYYKGQKMGQGDEMELGDMMQKVYKERETSVQSIEVDRLRRIVKPRTWENSTKRLVEVLG